MELHPKFINDFDKVIYKIYDKKQSDYQHLTSESIHQSINDVIQKLEQLLDEREFKSILLRFALYHKKYPPKADDDEVQRELKSKSLAFDSQNQLVPYKVMGKLLGTSKSSQQQRIVKIMAKIEKNIQKIAYGMYDEEGNSLESLLSIKKTENDM